MENVAKAQEVPQEKETKVEGEKQSLTSSQLISKLMEESVAKGEINPLLLAALAPSNEGEDGSSGLMRMFLLSSMMSPKKTPKTTQHAIIDDKDMTDADKITMLDQLLTAKQAKINQLSDLITEKNAEISSLHRTVKSLQKRIEKLEDLNVQQAEKIAEKLKMESKTLSQQAKEFADAPMTVEGIDKSLKIVEEMGPTFEALNKSMKQMDIVLGSKKEEQAAA